MVNPYKQLAPRGIPLVCLRERHHWCLLSIESEKKDITEEGVHFRVVSA